MAEYRLADEGICTLLPDELKAIQQQKLKQFAVIVQGNPPLVVMIFYIDRIAAGPGASIFHGDRFRAENETCENT